MRFRKIDNPPTHQEAIMLPPPGEPYPVVVPLDMGFIRTERAYWSKTFDRADKNGIPLLRSTAQTMRNTLGTVVERGEEIRASVERGGNLGFSTVELIEWHMVGTKAVAWSRMWQEMTSEEFTPQASASGKRVEILTDLPFNSVIYCGVHANDETFVELFNTPRPNPALLRLGWSAPRSIWKL